MDDNLDKRARRTSEESQGQSPLNKFDSATEHLPITTCIVPHSIQFSTGDGAYKSFVDQLRQNFDAMRVSAPSPD